MWVGRRPGNRLCGRPVSLQCQHAGRVQERVHIARVLRGERRCGGGSGRTCITSWMYCAASWPCTCILAVSISCASTAHTPSEACRVSRHLALAAEQEPRVRAVCAHCWLDDERAVDLRGAEVSGRIFFCSVNQYKKNALPTSRNTVYVSSVPFP